MTPTAAAAVVGQLAIAAVFVSGRPADSVGLLQIQSASCTTRGGMKSAVLKLALHPGATDPYAGAQH